jgi:lipid A 4'-phosphatase
MNRTGLMIVLAVAVAVGVTFALDSDLDLKIAAPFYDIVIGGNHFGLRTYRPMMLVRDAILWGVTAMVMWPVLAFVLKLVRPRRLLIVPARAILFLLATLTLGPGLLVNITLKDHWGRPRPIDVAQFGGDEHFVAWWDPRGDCPSNCSFVSGDVSGAFWTLAPAVLTPPPWRVLAYAGALTSGSAMAALRLSFGAHFFSDVVFAGVLMFIVIWLLHGLIYRWRCTRLSDEELERGIEHVTMQGYERLRRLVWGRRDG